jgi:lipopolysaccharide export system permease protein
LIPKIDRLVIKDVLPHWLFGVGLFASLLMAATYLGRIAGFIVDGVPPMIVLELTGLLLFPILTKTFTIAVLLAALLAFGRLSSDSEIVAMRAAGASVYRIIFPVLIFSTIMATGTLIFNENFVPFASNKYDSLTADVLRHVHTEGSMPVAYPVIENKKLRMGIVAQDMDWSKERFSGVTVIAYDDQGKRSFMMFADRLTFDHNALGNLLNPKGAEAGVAYHWRLSGHVTLVSPNFDLVTNVKDDVWPSQMPLIDQSFHQLSEPKDADFDRLTMAQLRQFIIFHRKEGDMTDKNLHNYEYGYWTKIAIPMGAIMFGVLGAALGIQGHRSGTASGYGIAIGITFMFVLLGNVMSIWAQGGVIPAWAAAFTPLALGTVAAGVIMWRRNG